MTDADAPASCADASDVAKAPSGTLANTHAIKRPLRHVRAASVPRVGDFLSTPRSMDGHSTQFMLRNELLHGALGFVLGASVVGALSTPPATQMARSELTATAAPAEPARASAASPVPARDTRPAPDYVSDPAGAPTGPASQSEAGRVFARTLREMLERRSEAGGAFDATRFREENQALFCEFDGAMNTMSTDERQQAIDALGFTRDVLNGKNHLEFHGCSLPRHTECPDEPVPER